MHVARVVVELSILYGLILDGNPEIELYDFGFDVC